MLYLKRLMLSILMLCTLGYGSAWAFDAHVVSEGFHIIDVGDIHNDSDHGATSDHCGHASAHIVGLFNHATLLFAVNKPQAYSEPLQDFNSFVPLLYLRPPSV